MDIADLRGNRKGGGVQGNLGTRARGGRTCGGQALEDEPWCRHGGPRCRHGEPEEAKRRRGREGKRERLSV